MQKEKYRAFVLLFLAGMLSVHLVLLWNSLDLIRKGYPDFTIFYSGGSILRQGLAHQLYDEATQYRVQQQFAAGVSIRQGPLPYNHPPFEAVAFVPFTLAPYPVAFVIWDLCNLAFLSLMLLVLRPALPELKSVSVALWLLACVAFFPVFFALLQGQDILFLALLFAAVYVLLQRNSDIAAGCCLGLGLFRFHLVLPLLLILLWQKRTKVVFGFLMTAAALAAISVAIIGWQGALEYPGQVWQLEQDMQRHQTIFPLRMANIRGLLENFLPLTSKPVLAIAVAVISLALVVFAASKSNFKTASRSEFDLSFSLCVVVTLLASYHTLPYDLSLLLLPIALTIHYLFNNQKIDSRTRLTLIVPFVVLFFSPLHMFLEMRTSRYNLFALVLLWWCWALFKELGRLKQTEAPAS